MASKSARKRRKRRPTPSKPPGTGSSPGVADSSEGVGSGPEPPIASPDGSRSASQSTRRPRPGSGPEPPPAPWGNFPLVELSVLLGIVMLIAGFFFVTGSRAPILIATGLVLGSIGGLELSIREHFAGFHSHTMILAGIPALAVLGALFYAGPDGLPPLLRAAIGLAVFAASAALLIRIFSRRSGGLRYRFKPLRSRDR